MPRYFFGTMDVARERDAIGTELAGLDEARIEAVKLAGELITDHPEVVSRGVDMIVFVSDEDGRMVLKVTTSITESDIDA